MKYPPDNLEFKSHKDKILWMLNNNPYCQWKDFLEKPLNIPRASLSKYLNRLKRRNYIEHIRIPEEKYNIYKITSLGQIEYSEMLEDYDLDPQVLLKEKIKKFKSISDITLKFFNKIGLKSNSVKIRFNKYLSMMDYSDKGYLFRNFDHYLLTILFLSINHPEESPNFISIREFSGKYEIPESSLTHYVETLMEINPYLHKFFKIDIDYNNSYYFTENDTLEILLKKIIQDFAENKFHDLILNNPTSQIDYYLNDQDIEKISKIICEKYGILSSDLEFIMYSFLPDYISNLSYELKTEPILLEGSDISKKITMRIIQGFTDYYTPIDPDITISFLAFNQENLNEAKKLFDESLNIVRRKNFEDALKKINEALELNSAVPVMHFYKGILFLNLKKLEKAIESIDRAIRMLEEHKNDILDIELFNSEMERYNEVKNELTLSKKEIPIVIDFLFNAFTESNYQPIKESHLINQIQKISNLDPDFIRETLEMVYCEVQYFFKKGEYIVINIPLEQLKEAVKIRKPSFNIVELFNSFKLIVPEPRKIDQLLSVEKISSQLDDYRILTLLEKNLVSETKDIKLIKKLIKDEKFNEALLEIDRLLNENKENLNYFQLKAFILNNLKRNKEALVIINQAINTDDQNELSYIIKTEILIDLKKFDEASKIIDLGIVLNPDNFYFHFKRILVAAISEDPNRILKTLERFNQLNHNISYFYYVQALFDNDFERYNKAYDAIEKAINLDKENPKYYSLKALILFLIGKFDESLESVDYSIKLDSKDSINHELKSVILFHLNKLESALQQINIAIDINPNLVSHYIQKCIILFVLGKYDDALELIDYAIELDPQNWKPYALKLFFLIGLGEFETSMDLFEKFDDLLLEEDNEVYYILKALILSFKNDYDNAFKALDKADAIAPNNYGAVYIKVKLLISKGDFEEALRIINIAIKQNPNYSDLYLNKAIILKNQEKFNLALKSIERAIEIQPTYDDYYYEKAEILIELDKFESALVNIEKAIEFNPNDSTYWHVKAEILKTSNEYEEGIRAINKAIELDPKNDHLFYHKANILNLISDHKNALIMINDAIDLNPKNIAYYEEKIDILDNMNQFDIALEVADDLFELFPDDPDIYYIKFELLYRMEKFNECLRLYEEAIEIFSKVAIFYVGKAEILEKFERYEEAIENYKLAFKLSPDSFHIIMIAEILFKSKKYDETFKILDKNILEMDDEKSKVELFNCKYNLLMKVEKYEDSLIAINKAIEYDPEKSWLYIKKSYVLMKLQKYEPAIQVSREAILLSPSNDRAYYLQGKCLYLIKKFKKAIDSFDNAIKYASEDISKIKTFFYRGLSYKEIGDLENALKNFTKCKKVATNEKKPKWVEKANNYILDLIPS